MNDASSDRRKQTSGASSSGHDPVPGINHRKRRDLSVLESYDDFGNWQVRGDRSYIRVHEIRDLHRSLLGEGAASVLPRGGIRMTPKALAGGDRNH